MATVQINCDDISSGLGDWAGSGITPYVNAEDANYISCATKKGVTGWLKFEDTSASGTITAVTLSIRAKSADGTGDITADISNNNGSSSSGTSTFSNWATSYETKSNNVLTFYDTWAKINAAAVRLNKENSTILVTVDHIYLTVTYTADNPQIFVQECIQADAKVV